MVLMMRQPPAAVPAPMTSRSTTFTQVRIVNCGSVQNCEPAGQVVEGCRTLVAVNRVRAMMPMVFWASFVPWQKLIQAALTIWTLPNTRLSWAGGHLRKSRISRPMTRKPIRAPQTGETNIGSTTLGSSPVILCVTGFITDHLMTCQSPCAAARVAPHRPPIRAWLELEGSPNHQVSRFQTIAASRAHRMVVRLTTSPSTRPAPIVVATAVPESAPSRLQVAAMATAWRGVRVRVATWWQSRWPCREIR